MMVKQGVSSSTMQSGCSRQHQSLPMDTCAVTGKLTWNNRGAHPICDERQEHDTDELQDNTRRGLPTELNPNPLWPGLIRNQARAEETNHGITHIMETLNKPDLALMKKGESIKVFKVTGQAGMMMPLHHSTKEAVVIVQEGRALLKMGEKQLLLQEGEVFVIPAAQNHSLSVETGLKAFVVMAVDSSIEFEK